MLAERTQDRRLDLTRLPEDVAKQLAKKLRARRY